MRFILSAWSRPGRWLGDAALIVLASGLAVISTEFASRNGEPVAAAPERGRPISAAVPAGNHGRGDCGLGRSAATTSDIPARGWKGILWRVYETMTECRVIAVAAGVTFYVLLAIFPAIAALISVYGLFADPSTMEDRLNGMADVIPGGAIDVIREQMHRIASQGGGTLGFAFALGLAVSLWSANAGVKAIFDALNVVYGEKEKRGFLGLNAMSLCFTIAAIGFLLVSLSVVAVVPALLRSVGLESSTQWIVAIGRWPLLYIVVCLALASVYRYGPSREEPQWRWVTWGSAAAGALWIVASVLFSWYAANFGTYNKTYGSLGAAIGFMTWLWISNIVVLLGAAIDAEMEHQTARDTAGGRKPLGARAAKTADTVGAAKAA
jgi:membrane protein